MRHTMHNRRQFLQLGSIALATLGSSLLAGCGGGGGSGTPTATGNISNTEGTVYAETYMGTSLGSALRLVGDAISSGTPLSGRILPPNVLVELWDEVAVTTSQISATGARYKCASTWKTSGKKVPYINGTAGSGNAYDGSYFTGDICVGAGGSMWLCAPIRNIRIWSAVMPIRTDGTVASQISG